jgi:hypothetical protein
MYFLNFEITKELHLLRPASQCQVQKVKAVVDTNIDPNGNRSQNVTFHSNDIAHSPGNSIIGPTARV